MTTNDARRRAVFGEEHADTLRRSKAARSAAEAAAAARRPPALHEGPIGLLDEDAEAGWEASMSKRRRAQWAALKHALDEAGPTMRWRAVGYVMRGELDYARKVYRVARNIDHEPFKARLVRRAGEAVVERLGVLESRLAGMYDVALSLGVLIDDVEKAYHMVTMGHQTLRTVTDRGAWAAAAKGLAAGRGIPGLHTEEGVDAARRAARRAARLHSPEE